MQAQEERAQMARECEVLKENVRKLEKLRQEQERIIDKQEQEQGN